MTFACCLSGALVGALAGGLGAALLSVKPEGVLACLVGGAVLGALVLRRIAASETILGGAIVGAILPFGLILLGALRSGRIFEAGSDLGSPLLLIGAVVLLIVGGLLGAALVAVRKLIVWLFCGA
jgi:hypothetical protein